MNKSIIEVYSYTHHLIKKDSGLINKIKAIVCDPMNQKSNKYLCTGLQVDGIYLGIDFMQKHVRSFKKILTNTLVIDNASYSGADFSRILLKLIVNKVHVATLTEDVSENGKYKIYDEGITFGPVNDYQLLHHFRKDVVRSVFVVYSEETKFPNNKKYDRIKKPDLIPLRLPIIDLDHADLVPPFDNAYMTDAEQGEGDLFYVNI